MRTIPSVISPSPILSFVLSFFRRKSLWPVVISLGLIMALGSVFITRAYAQQIGTNTPEQLVNKLRKGGYILYVRHAATDHSQGDRDLTDFSKCELQRNLSAQGKAETKIMAATLAVLEIKVDRVITSPYCRSVDTAVIAFGRYEVVEEMRAAFLPMKPKQRLL